MGLAFKPNIDDLRESPALYITKSLKDENFDIFAVEPNIKEHKELKLMDYEEALDEADIIVYLVAHKEFKKLNNTNKIVIDFCGIMK